MRARSRLLHSTILSLGLVSAVYAQSPPASGAGQVALSAEVLGALNDLGNGMVTPSQRALLFINNRALNQARLNGWISDSHYQAAQGDFASLNQEFGAGAAQDVGAGFSKQVSKSKCYQPGTDSDYITRVTDPQQIRDMQDAYNRRINSFLGENGVTSERTAWQEELDTDFMADPSLVNSAQFEEIAQLNNDAYKRRLAADYEKVSRAGAKITYADGTTLELPQEILPEHVREYAAEMQDFIAKKQAKIAHFQQDPAALSDPAVQADLARTMMQEQKYIDRINAANAAVRSQSGLPAAEFGTPPAPGDAAQPSIASRGALRSPDNVPLANSASSVGTNSLNRSILQLAETYAEAANTNGRFATTAAGDIARIAQDLPPADKGAMIDRMRALRGDGFAADVAANMRRQAVPSATAQPASAGVRQAITEAVAQAQNSGASPASVALAATQAFDEAVAARLGVSNNLAGAGATRVRVNQLAAAASPTFNTMLNVYFTTKEGLQSGADYRDYVFHIVASQDPNTPDDVAQLHLQAAQQLAETMAARGTLGTGMLGLMHAFPTMGAAIGTLAISYNGTRWVLETEPGQIIDRAARDAIDAGMTAVDEALAGETQEMREQRERQHLLASYAAAIERGQISLAEGVTDQDLVDAVMRGDLPNAIRTMLVEKPAPSECEEEKPANQSYAASWEGHLWYGDNGRARYQIRMVNDSIEVTYEYGTPSFENDAPKVENGKVVMEEVSETGKWFNCKLGGANLDEAQCEWSRDAGDGGTLAVKLEVLPQGRRIAGVQTSTFGPTQGEEWDPALFMDNP